jgi:hypothetical protein
VPHSEDPINLVRGLAFDPSNDDSLMVAHENGGLTVRGALAPVTVLTWAPRAQLWDIREWNPTWSETVDRCMVDLWWIPGTTGVLVTAERQGVGTFGHDSAHARPRLTLARPQSWSTR